MPEPKTALEEWIPKAAAAKLLGVSLRQLERREQKGYIEKKQLPRLPTESTARVLYSRADLVALRAGKPNVHARVVDDSGPDPEASAEPAVSNGAAPTLALVRRAAPAGTEKDPFAALAAHLARLSAAYPAPPVAKPWLSIDEAVEYSGLPRSWLVAQARAGAAFAIDVASGGARQIWRFNREALGAARAGK